MFAFLPIIGPPFQLQNPDGTWTTVFTATTESGGSNNGGFIVRWIPNTTGVFNFRRYYDGGDMYAPCVSQTVTLTVNSAPSL
jgi:hypothetical protein